MSQNAFGWIFDRSVPEPNSGCFLWAGSLNGAGYGGHRDAYEMVCGPVPEGMELDHLCRVKSCINPVHMEPVTHSENLRRASFPKRKGSKFCLRGHEFSPENTILLAVKDPLMGDRIKRNCRICINSSSRETKKQAYRRSVSHAVIPMALRTHCPKGHTYTVENTGVTVKATTTLRYCRQCKREATRLRDQRRREAKLR